MMSERQHGTDQRNVFILAAIAHGPVSGVHATTEDSGTMYSSDEDQYQLSSAKGEEFRIHPAGRFLNLIKLAYRRQNHPLVYCGAGHDASKAITPARAGQDPATFSPVPEAPDQAFSVSV